MPFLATSLCSHAVLRRGVALLALGCAGWAGATTVAPPEFPTLVNESDYIIHAVTKRVSAEKRPVANGVRIVTMVEFEVLEVVAGRAPARVTLEFLGGRVGHEHLRVDGMPEFRPGDEDVLFVSGNGQSICPLYAMMHGRYPVRLEPATGRKVVVRTDGGPLQSTAQIAAPLVTRPTAALATGLAPAAFIEQIRATVRLDSMLNRAKP
jgi:hypothetical protein